MAPARLWELVSEAMARARTSQARCRVEGVEGTPNEEWTRGQDVGKSKPLPVAAEMDPNATSTLFRVGVSPFNLHSQPEEEAPLSYPFADKEVEDQ